MIETMMKTDDDPDNDRDNDRGFDSIPLQLAPERRGAIRSAYATIVVAILVAIVVESHRSPDPCPDHRRIALGDGQRVGHSCG